MKIRPLKNKTFKTFTAAAIELHKRRKIYPEFAHVIIINKNNFKVKSYFKIKKKNYSQFEFVKFFPGLIQ